MYRMLLGTGLLLCGLFQEEAILRAQEPAFISDDVAVRFEQSPGFYHYAALCRVATAYSATVPPAGLPWASTEPGVCWYVMGTKMRNDGGKVDGSPMVDGKLVISAHHVRFIPSDRQSRDLYVDFKPEETELLHHPGQMFAALGTTKILIGFKFSKICPTCAPGAPIPEGTNSALLDQEFQLVVDGIKHFETAYRRIWVMSSQVRVEVRAQNQPSGNDVPEAMRLYSDLNRQLAEECPEPAKSCIRSYAVYQACIADHGGAKCGAEPNCSAACPVTVTQLQNLKARACVQLDQAGASLIPDWTDAVRRKNAGNLPIQPLPTGVLDIQLTSGSNPPAGRGCSVQAAYLRASNPGVQVASTAGSGGSIHAASPAAVPVAKASTTAATPSTVSPPRPSTSQAVSHPTATASPSAAAAARPSTTAQVKPSTPSAPKPPSIPAEKPTTMASAKASAATASTTASAKPGAASAAKPAQVPADSSSPAASAKSGATTPSTAAVTKPNIATATKLSSASASTDRSGTTAFAKPNPSTSAKTAAVPAEKLGVTPSARTDVPVKSAVSESKPSTIALADVKPAVPSGKSSAFVEAQPVAAPETPTEKPATNTLKIAPGTAEGMLVKKVPPTYPLEAKVARVQGTVQLNVTISKTGTVTGVDVVSGPEVLQSAAVDAVKQWQFRPFSLLGEPVEFETTVHVVFGMGGAPARAQAQGHPSPN